MYNNDNNNNNNDDDDDDDVDDDDDDDDIIIDVLGGYSREVEHSIKELVGDNSNTTYHFTNAEGRPHMLSIYTMQGALN